MYIYLLQNHADPSVRNSRQESPLDLAAQYGRMETVSTAGLTNEVILPILIVL